MKWILITCTAAFVAVVMDQQPAIADVQVQASANATVVDPGEQPDRVGRAEQLFAAGDFLSAANLARSSSSPEGFTLAARALLAHAEFVVRAEARTPWYRQAEGFAAEAVRLDSGHAEAYRYRAMALGSIARTLSPLEVYHEGYVDTARSLIDKALVLEPQSPWVYAILGAWHAEIVGAAGASLADVLFDATKNQAKWAFRHAISLDRTNPILYFEYARALARMAPDEGQAEIREALEMASSLPSRDALEILTAERARSLLASLASH